MIPPLVCAVGLLQLGAGVGTTFAAEGDRHNPSPFLACLRRDLDDGRDLVVALRRPWRCRARIYVWNPRTRRGTWAVVGDRGPRRAAIDLAPLVAQRIGHNGREQVAFVVVGGER